MFLSFDEAVRFIAPDGDIHTLTNPSANMLLGADWRRGELLAALKVAKRIEVTGEQAQSMKHGLAITDGDDLLYIETTRRTDERRSAPTGRRAPNGETE